jgi:hypothetical protein
MCHQVYEGLRLERDVAGPQARPSRADLGPDREGACETTDAKALAAKNIGQKWCSMPHLQEAT